MIPQTEPPTSAHPAELHLWARQLLQTLQDATLAYHASLGAFDPPGTFQNPFQPMTLDNHETLAAMNAARTQLEQAAPRLAQLAVDTAAQLTRTQTLAENLVHELARDLSVAQRRSEIQYPADWARWSHERQDAFLGSEARLSYMAGLEHAENVVKVFKATLEDPPPPPGAEPDGIL